MMKNPIPKGKRGYRGMSIVNEICKVLVGSEIIRDGVALAIIGYAKEEWEGSFAEVEFDRREVFGWEDSGLKVMGFYHTHPGDFVTLSGIDVKTMKGWSVALGRRMLCFIEGNGEIDATYWSGEGIIENGIKEFWVDNNRDVFVVVLDSD